ncbi:MAG: hypothetical protein L6Q81_07460 [Bacteroidia bacterium]|nr:hypothetical protein [Bacteroidia bacterium]
MKKWQDIFYPLGLFVRNENIEEFSKCVSEIHSLRGKKRAIPHTLMDQFFALIVDKTWVEAEKHREISDGAKPYIEKVRGQFSSDPSYWFSGERVVKAPSFEDDPISIDFKMKYSIEQMIQHTVRLFLSIEPLPERKSVAVKFFFDRINTYCETQMNRKHQREFGEYKRMAYAGYLAYIFKYDDLYQKKKTVANFYACARNTLVTSLGKDKKNKKSQRKR